MGLGKSFSHILYNATKDRAKYIFGTSIASFEEKDSSVEVRFANGKTDQFDLLVGADGQGSRTRKMMLGPNTKDTFYPLKGLYVGYFTIPRPMQKGEEYIATMYMATQRRGMMTRRHNPNEIQVYIGCKTDSERLKKAHRGDVKEQKEALSEILQGAGWQTDDILNSLKDAENFYCEHLGLVKLDSWSRGRVVLVGDAAYCPSANTGMGTTSSVVGAYILAGEIGKHRGNSQDKDNGNGENVKIGLATALKAYEQKFRPFMTQVQKGVSEDDSFDAITSTAFGIAAMNCLMGVASFLRLNVFGRFFLRETVKGWDLPDYAELLRD